MKTFNRNLFFQIVILFLAILQINGQKNFTLYQLEKTPQSFYLNPGFRQTNRVYVTFPALNHNFSATAAVVPLPQKKSATKSPSLLLDLIILSSSRSLFCVG